jgi:NAD(P)-dependent dehydrogenase (short-subunit alcohol dehydrogenase family)
MGIRFEGKTAIVTGAGTGLGRAHALLLAGLGANVVVNDPGRTGEGTWTADLVAEEIQRAGSNAVANHDSVAERKGAQNIVQCALDNFGRIDALVNNAGILRDKTFAKMDLDDFELVLRIHLLGSVYVTKAAWPHMAAQKYGRIVLTTSPAGLIGSFGQSNYATAKTGMIGLMNTLKLEGANAGIRVNLLSPVAGTAMTQGILSDELYALQSPESVSPAVGWLCSEACDFSGEIIVASAGQFTAVRMMRAEGVQFDPARPAVPDDLEAVRDRIFNFSHPRPFIATLDAEVREALGIA